MLFAEIFFYLKMSPIPWDGRGQGYAVRVGTQAQDTLDASDHHS